MAKLMKTERAKPLTAKFAKAAQSSRRKSTGSAAQRSSRFPSRPLRIFFAPFAVKSFSPMLCAKARKNSVVWAVAES
jgi:hypothetical protein